MKIISAGACSNVRCVDIRILRRPHVYRHAPTPLPRRGKDRSTDQSRDLISRLKFHERKANVRLRNARISSSCERYTFTLKCSSFLPSLVGHLSERRGALKKSRDPTSRARLRGRAAGLGGCWASGHVPTSNGGEDLFEALPVFLPFFRQNARAYLQFQLLQILIFFGT